MEQDLKTPGLSHRSDSDVLMGRAHELSDSERLAYTATGIVANMSLLHISSLCLLMICISFRENSDRQGRHDSKLTKHD